MSVLVLDHSGRVWQIAASLEQFQPGIRGTAWLVGIMHRIGQTRKVMVYRLIAHDTIEDKVMALNARKAKLFASVVDDGDVFGSTLTADDIRGLLA